MPDDEAPTPDPPDPPATPDPPDPPDLESGTPEGSSDGDPDAPSTPSRKEVQAEMRGSSNVKWYAGAAVMVLLIGGMAAAVVLTAPAPKKAAAAPPSTTTTTTTVPPPVVLCPLTGTPALGGVVPPRPALATKIGNYTDDRPSAGLNQADIVFEEPVEGSYTRLVAVFQCQGAALVGDLRSARQPDVGILSQLSNPLFVHAGGINQVLNLIAGAPIQDKNVLNGGFGSVTVHPSGRYAPYATFTDTTPAWALNPGDTSPPAPLFTFSPAPPVGSVSGSGVSAHIPFSTASDVTWTWDPATSAYLRSYSGAPDKLLDGTQTSSSNVVIMTVPTAIGSWVENAGGGREVEVTATGSGPLVVLRDGVAITGTWTRSSLTQPAVLTATDGTPITLRPGNTWEELAPQGVTVTITAAAPPATTIPTSTTTTTTTRPKSKTSTTKG